MGIVLATNQAWALLSTAVATTDTTITLQSGQGARFPIIAGGSGNWFYVTLIDSSNNLEICQVTATSGDQFTVTRGVDGTSPRAYASGNRVELRWNAAVITDLQTEINAVQTNLTAAITTLLAELNAQIPLGMITLWNGATTAIPTGWALCNGTTVNGVVTPDLRDKFVVGAGNSYAVNATGGTTTNTLSTANLPSHNHGVNDPGHSHGVSDPGHSHSVNDPGHGHGVSDPGHAHGALFGNFFNTVNSNVGYVSTFGGGGSSIYQTSVTGGSGTGIGINAAGSNISLNGSATGIGIYGSGTGISIQYTGGGAAVNNLPPYFAKCYIIKVGVFS